jgi:hypothetical protein
MGWASPVCSGVTLRHRKPLWDTRPEPLFWHERGFRDEQNPFGFCRMMEEFREKHLTPRHERSRRRDRDDRRASESSTRQQRSRT